MIESTEFEGIFEFRPLEPGYGLTIGNALRRVMLSSLEGYAITSLRINQVDHEFSTLPGIVEDVTEMILNFKQVRLKQQIDAIDDETVSVAVSNQDKLTAGDLQKFISGFQVLNPDLVICNMDKSVNLNFEFTIDKGRGYVPAEENKKATAPIGTIAIDSVYTPIKNVKYSIENFRVEQKTDYEKLIFEIVTDGSIHPKDALTEAAKTLIHHFMLFSDERITLEADEIAQSEVYDEESLHMRQLLKTKLIFKHCHILISVLSSSVTTSRKYIHTVNIKQTSNSIQHQREDSQTTDSGMSNNPSSAINGGNDDSSEGTEI